VSKAAAAYLPKFLLAIGCLVTLSCTDAPRSVPTIQTASSHGQYSRTRGGPPRDLSEDEQEGGHTLKRHVGRTDAELRDRLKHEPNISAASTYTDRTTAEFAVGESIRQNQDRVQRWLDRPGRHPNLVLDYRADQPIGRTMNRGDSNSIPCSNAVVVLKWAGSRHYYVLTSYPECR